MSTKRKTNSARFKAKIALEAYRGNKTAAELAYQLIKSPLVS